MYGDTLVMRRRAAQLREQGEHIRAMADRLVTHSDETDWAGRAADAMRDRVRERATHLREVAHAHDTAAVSLEKHLAECDRRSDTIAGVQRRASSLVADARDRIARGAAAAEPEAGQSTQVQVAPTPEDQVLAAFAPPPPGHKDWLDVELPGL
jgi:hypothetical protein